MERAPIDWKYRIKAEALEHGKPHDEFDAILFLAHDRALPAALRKYLEETRALGGDAVTLSGLEKLIERVEQYQAEHSDEVKVADAPADIVLVPPDRDVPRNGLTSAPVPGAASSTPTPGNAS